MHFISFSFNSMKYWIFTGTSQFDRWNSKFLFWRWCHRWAGNSTILRIFIWFEFCIGHWQKRQITSGSFNDQNLLSMVNVCFSLSLSFDKKKKIKVICDSMKIVEMSKIFICVFLFYRFSVDSTLNIFKKLDLLTRSEILILPGAAHADDLCYLFR